MAKIATLLEKLPTFAEARMVTNGFAIWLAWKTEINPAVPQTLTDYGGMLVSQGRRESLWFFFSTDAFLALARLEVWARLNPMPIFAQIMPAKLLLGMKLELSLSLEVGLGSQEAVVPDDFRVLVHPKLNKQVEGIPGLSLGATTQMRGLAAVPWTLLQADPRLPYQSNMCWFVILKPVGNPLDKHFQTGWREFYQEIEALLKRHKIQFLIHDFFVMFPMTQLRQLRLWCKEFLTMIIRVKEQEPERYWPCVSAVVDRRGYNLTPDLHKKIPLDWEQLMPDFPLMSYRMAFLLGEGFKINDVRFSIDQGNVEDWCNVSLSEDQSESAGTLQIELPKRLVAGKNQPCFYCGLRSHTPSECPSRALVELRPSIWDDVAQMDFEIINKGLQAIDHILGHDPDGQAMMNLLSGVDAESKLIQAFFEINAPVQHRMLRAVWRSYGKDYPRGLRQLGPEQGEFIWEALDMLQRGETVQGDRLLAQAALKGPRHYQPRTLQGFSAMEKGDFSKASGLWREAEGLSITPLQQAYHVYLQGRILEMSGKPQGASALYRQALKHCPRWLDAHYRQGVCLVKMGFAEQAMGFFEDIIQKDAHMFNRALFDPELDRGHIHLLSFFFLLWAKAEEKAGEERRKLDELKEEVARWFVPEHPFFPNAQKSVAALTAQGEIKNYVAFNAFVQGLATFGKELQLRIDEETKALRATYEGYMERLKVIRNEASWFPFPRILLEFNKDFNYCAKNLNWAFKQPFQKAEVFRRAHEISDLVAERIHKLEDQLTTLKIVRDSTLFVLILGKTFFWLELTGLVLSLLLLPTTIYFGQKLGYSWASGLLSKQKWEIQKGLIVILSISALAVAALRTALVFEKRKDKLFRGGDGKDKKDK